MIFGRTVNPQHILHVQKLTHQSTQIFSVIYDWLIEQSESRVRNDMQLWH